MTTPITRRKTLGALGLATFYAALGMGANPALARPPVEELRALRAGDMRKLVLHDAPLAFPQTGYTDEAGSPRGLDEHRGRIVLLNFWATWCAPCREEMPDLDALQRERGGADFAVVPIATGRNAIPGIKRFFAETGVSDLPILLDPRGQLAREAGVLGLPVTVILDRDGQELGRMQGGAHWNDANAHAILDPLIAGA